MPAIRKKQGRVGDVFGESELQFPKRRICFYGDLNCYNCPKMATAIIGSGRALPQQEVSNVALAKQLNISTDEIVRKTGVETRYWSDLKDTASSLAIEAALNALQSAGVSANNIALILVTTTTPDLFFPSTACLVQKGLAERMEGMRQVPAFDINASCSGFIYAMSIADQFLQNNSAGFALVIATDVKSRFIDPKDASTAILFGDGAGAVVLGNKSRGIRKIRLGADGAHHALIRLPAGGSALPLSRETLETGGHFMDMEGKGLFRVAVRKMETALTEFLVETGLDVNEVDYFIFHQANLRILEALFQRVSIPVEKTELSLKTFGNTSSSTIPIALDRALEKQKIKQGDRIILSSFGGGVTWGNILIDW